MILVSGYYLTIQKHLEKVHTNKYIKYLTIFSKMYPWFIIENLY